MKKTQEEKARHAKWVLLYKSQQTDTIRAVHYAPTFEFVEGKPHHGTEPRDVLVWHVNKRGYAMVSRFKGMPYVCPASELDSDFLKTA